MVLQKQEYILLGKILSSLIIAIGLPVSVYFVFKTLNPIEQLKNVSFEIGQELVRGMQHGLNETELTELVKKLSNAFLSNNDFVAEIDNNA